MCQQGSGPVSLHQSDQPSSARARERSVPRVLKSSDGGVIVLGRAHGLRLILGVHGGARARGRYRNTCLPVEMDQSRMVWLDGTTDGLLEGQMRGAQGADDTPAENLFRQMVPDQVP